MKATDLLKKQHKEVKDLFKRIESAKDDDTKSEYFEELAQSLVAHDAIEREIFYPACEEALGENDLLGESLVEHGVVEFTLNLADQAQGQEDFTYKCTVLKEIIEHHVEEEEHDLFPKVEKAMDKSQLEELTEQLQERFEEVMAEDFRVLLRSNLQQVLKGATKTTPRKTTTKKSSSRGKSMRKSA